METRASYLLVGSFVLALLAGLFVFVIYIAKLQFGDRGDLYHIYFTGSVTGLQEGSPVRYAGIPVGRVTDIRIAPQNVSLVRVTVELEDGMPIKEDAIASLEVQGLTGAAYVQISGGTQQARPLLPENGNVPVIQSRPSTLAAVVNTAPQVLSRTVELADRLAAVLSPENQMALAETLENLRVLTGTLSDAAAEARTVMGGLNALAGDARRHAGLLTASADATLKQAHRTLDMVDKNAVMLGTDIRELTRSLKRTSDQIAGLVTENRGPIRDFTGGGLYDLTVLIGDLRELSGNLSRLTMRLERDPAAFLFGNTGRGEEVR